MTDRVRAVGETYHLSKSRDSVSTTRDMAVWLFSVHAFFFGVSTFLRENVVMVVASTDCLPAMQ